MEIVLTVTGKTIKQNLDELIITEVPEQQIVKPVEQSNSFCWNCRNSKRLAWHQKVQ